MPTRPTAAPTEHPPHIGQLHPGPHNAITDVPGVRVGHCTLAAGQVQTGVSVILPHTGNLFTQRVAAGLAILNGFGKSAGLMQLRELGQIETPIALTNTFAVGTIAQAQIAHCIAANPECGRSQPTVNPLVLECNDGYLNHIQHPAITPEHYTQALQAALHPAPAPSAPPQGSVGAGRGMSAFGHKGGIGSASRIAHIPGAPQPYTVGALVLANFGLPHQLLWNGWAAGAALAQAQPHSADTAPASAAPSPEHHGPEHGSIIIVLASDAPLDSRQLSRLALRAGAGLARTGSVYGHGSGDIAIAFSTAYTLNQPGPHDSALRPPTAVLHDARLDPLFQAAADSVEQAILHALWHAQSVTGRDGHHRANIRTTLARLRPPST